MAKRTKRPAGRKADAKPGSQALQKLLTYFSHDATPIYGHKATVGQEGAALAQKAVEHLDAGNAQEAVQWAVQAMLHYCMMEKHELLREHFDEKRDLAEWWKTETEPAVNREIIRRDKHEAWVAEHLRIPKPTLDRAIELMAKYHGESPLPRKTTAAKQAARELKAEGQEVSYKTILKHLPAWLRGWND